MEWRKPIAMLSVGIALVGSQIGCSPSTSEPLRSEESTEVRVDTSHSPRLNTLEKEVTKESLELTKKRFEKEDIDITIVEDDADVFMEYATVYKPINWLLNQKQKGITDGYADKVQRLTQDEPYVKANLIKNINYVNASKSLLKKTKENQKAIRSMIQNDGWFMPPDTIYINIQQTISSFMEDKGLYNRYLADMVKRQDLQWNISNTEMHEIGHGGGLLHLNTIDKQISSCNGPKENFMSTQKENINQTYNDEQLRILKKGFEEDSRIQKLMSKNSRLLDLKGYYRKNVDLRAYCK